MFLIFDAYMMYAKGYSTKYIIRQYIPYRINSFNEVINNIDNINYSSYLTTKEDYKKC